MEFQEVNIDSGNVKFPLLILAKEVPALEDFHGQMSVLVEAFERVGKAMEQTLDKPLDIGNGLFPLKKISKQFGPDYFDGLARDGRESLQRFAFQLRDSLEHERPGPKVDLNLDKEFDLSLWGTQEALMCNILEGMVLLWLLSNGDTLADNGVETNLLNSGDASSVLSNVAFLVYNLWVLGRRDVFEQVRQLQREKKTLDSLEEHWERVGKYIENENAKQEKDTKRRGLGKKIPQIDTNTAVSFYRQAVDEYGPRPTVQQLSQISGKSPDYWGEKLFNDYNWKLNRGGQFLKLCEKELTKARNQAKTPEKKKLYSKALLLIGGLIAYGQEKNPKRGISPETFPAKEEQTGEMGSEAEGGEEGERARKSDRLYNIRMQIARMKDEGVKTLLLGRGRKTTLDELKKEAAELQQDLLNAGGRG